MNTEYTPTNWSFWQGQSPDQTQIYKVPPENDESNGKGWDFKSVTIANEQGLIVAEVKAMTTDHFVNDFDELEINAHLIKTAPKLLAFAKDMASRYAAIPSISDEANALIAEATGKTLPKLENACI